MNNSKFKCGGRGGCSFPVVIACNCGIPVLLLCRECISSHVLKPGNHRLIHLSQAQQLLNSSSSSTHIEESYISYLRIKSDILAYIQSLQDFKTRLKSFKFELIESIEKTFGYNTEKIDSILDLTYIQLNELNQESDNQALSRFEERGLEGVLSSYIYNMNLNIDSIKLALNDVIVLETKDSPQSQCQPQSITLTALSIRIQELQEHIQAQTTRSDELECRLNQLQQGTIRELQDKTSILEDLIIEQEARVITSEDSFKSLEDNMTAVYDTLEKLQSYPSTIIKETNQTIQEVQEAFNEKYARIDQEILNITLLIAKIQANSKATQYVQSHDIPDYINPIDIEAQKISEFKEVKLPQPKSAPFSINSDHSTSITYSLKNGTKQLIKYDSQIDTITKYNLDTLPYELRYATTTILSDGSVIIAGGQ